MAEGKNVLAMLASKDATAATVNAAAKQAAATSAGVAIDQVILLGTAS
jgi:hypothetical protein